MTWHRLAKTHVLSVLLTEFRQATSQKLRLLNTFADLHYYHVNYQQRKEQIQVPSALLNHLSIEKSQLRLNATVSYCNQLSLTTITESTAQQTSIINTAQHAVIKLCQQIY